MEGGIFFLLVLRFLLNIVGADCVLNWDFVQSNFLRHSCVFVSLSIVRLFSFLIHIGGCGG